MCENAAIFLTGLICHYIMPSITDCKNHPFRDYCYESQIIYHMNSILTDTKIYEILSVAEEIPKGKVTTYGRIAEITGREKNARLVGLSGITFLFHRHRQYRQWLHCTCSNHRNNTLYRFLMDSYSIFQETQCIIQLTTIHRWAA